MENNVEKEQEIVQEIMNNTTDYTIEELTVYLENKFQDAINTGKKVSFNCALSAVLNLYTGITLKYQRKEFCLLTIREGLEYIISRLKEKNYPDLTKEEALALMESTSTSPAPVKQE